MNILTKLSSPLRIGQFWMTIFSSPGHCPGWTVIGNSVCLSVCLWMALALPTDKMDPKYIIPNVLYMSGMNAHKKIPQKCKKIRQPAHQLCCVFLWGCLPSFSWVTGGGLCFPSSPMVDTVSCSSYNCASSLSSFFCIICIYISGWLPFVFSCMLSFLN